MDGDKVNAVRDWPTPCNLRDVRGFLGFANFYQRFIRDFARIARPLNDLTQKHIGFNSGAQQQDTFDQLCSAFTLAPILTLWDPD